MKKHLKDCLIVTGLLALGVTFVNAASVSLDSMAWTSDPHPFYGGDNSLYGHAFSSDGNIIGGKIDQGFYKVDAADGTVLETNYTFPDGARAALQIGSRIWFSGDNAQGVRSIADSTPWAAQTPSSYQLASIGAEGITTDGTSLFTNNDVTRDQVHKYSIDAGGTLSLDTSFDSDGIVSLGSGRVRGISYYDGWIFASNSGAGSGDLFAINASTGATVNMGAAGAAVQQLTAGSIDGFDFLAAVDLNNLYIWDLDMTGSPSVSNLSTFSRADLASQFGELNVPGSGGIGSVWIDDVNNTIIIGGGGDTPALLAINVTPTPALITYSTWAAGIDWGGQDASPTGDASGDGFENLISYALALDPLQPAPAAFLPSLESPADSLDYTYRQNETASDISFELQYSGSLQTPNWQAVIIDGETVTQETLSSDGLVELLRIHMPSANFPAPVFFRLEISTIDPP